MVVCLVPKAAFSRSKDGLIDCFPLCVKTRSMIQYENIRSSQNNDAQCDSVALGVGIALFIFVLRSIMTNTNRFPLSAFEVGPRMPSATITVVRLPQAVVRGRRGFSDGLIRVDSQKSLTVLKTSFAIPANVIRVTLSRTYAFRPDVPPTLENANDKEGAIVVT